MKEYKYTIEGKEYKVAIGDIADNVAEVTVNGEVFKVEMEPKQNLRRRRSYWDSLQKKVPQTKQHLQLMSTQQMP